MSDYYSVLGVDKDATAEQIKKAYRKLSLKYHPDKPQGDTKKFQEINEAYDTLGDGQKRKAYDVKKSGRFHQGNMPHGMPPDIFNMMFSRGMPGVGHNFPNVQIFRNGVRVNPNALRKPTPIIKTIHISLEEAFTGIQYPMEIERWIVEEKDTKRVESETIYVDVPKGIDNNEIIIVRNKGNIINDDLHGDIKVFVKIKKHDVFERKGLNLILYKNLSLKEALCGFKFNIKHLSGKTFSIDNENGKVINYNTKKVIQHMGLERNSHKGHLIIHFSVLFPETLTDSQRATLRDTL